MRAMFRRTVAIAALGVVAAAGAPAPAGAATVVVRPGRLDRFVITAPQTALAGESFIVRIDPYDAHGNLITDFPAKGPTFVVGVSSGEVSPAKLRAAELAGGASVKVADRRAGILDITVTEEDAATPLAAAQVRILPNRLERFVVNTPREAVAGSPFQARVIALDAFDNTKTDVGDVHESLRVEVLGTGTARAIDAAVPPFRGGEAILAFEPRAAGSLRILVQDTRSRAAGEGQPVEVGPGPLSRFALFAPKAAVAGQPFVVIVAAYDGFGNRVARYREHGDGVAFSASGTGVLSPATVPAVDFEGGQARVTFTYTKAEAVRIAAREQGREPSGESEPVVVAPADPDHFLVSTPAEAVAGEGFPAEIEALDRFGNRIEDYDLRGLEVLLSADGSGTLRPSSVSPASFAGGRARVTLSYDRAESFTVVAALSKESLEKIVAERRRRAAAPPEPEVSPDAAAREREAAQREREAAMRERAEQEQKREREAAAEARAEAQRARERAAEKAEKEATRKEAEAARREKVRTETPAPAPPAPAPATAAPAPEPAPVGLASAPRPLAPVVKIVEGVTVEESEGQTLVRVATSGPVSYNATTGSELSREWIWIELFPVRTAPGVPDSVPAEGGLVGQVLVRQAGEDKVRVSLQVLPPGISYVVTQQDRAVVVRVVKAP